MSRKAFSPGINPGINPLAGACTTGRPMPAEAGVEGDYHHASS